MSDWEDFEPSGQEENIERVGERIGWAVRAFLEERGVGHRFFADELRTYVRQHAGLVAPGSPDRILRALRQQRAIDYKVISRSESLYEILRIGNETPGAPGGAPAAPGGPDDGRNPNMEAPKEEYRVHPVAEMFPLLTGKDYEELRKAIASAGLLYCRCCLMMGLGRPGPFLFWRLRWDGIRPSRWSPSWLGCASGSASGRPWRLAR